MERGWDPCGRPLDSPAVSFRGKYLSRKGEGGVGARFIAPWGGPLLIVGEGDAEANRRESQGASPAPTMTRLCRPIRIMVGVPLAGTQ